MGRGLQGAVEGRAKAAPGGLTLLEILVSLTLTVLVLLVALGALRLGARSLQLGERCLADQERLRGVRELLDAQIQSQVPLVEEAEGDRRLVFRGGPEALRLATTRPLWGGRPGCMVVAYRTEGTEKGRVALFAAEAGPGEGTGREVRLIEADRIGFAYFRGEAGEAKGRWVAEMTDGTLLPERIRVTLSLGGETFTLVSPLRVRRVLKALPAGGGRP